MATREIDAADGRFDVFISHADTDKTWVETRLLPVLLDKNIHPCLAFRHFQPGAPQTSEIEKAVQSCPRTILVITHNYLRYDWKILDKMEVFDPGAGMRKFIPLVKETCPLPLYIKALVYLDFTDPSREAEEWERLITVLKQNRALELRETGSAAGTEGPTNPTDKPWYTDPFLYAIERNLRMIAAHWIQSGLSMPSNEFSFTAVFFANQIEILHRLEAELNHRFNELGTSRVNIAASPFQKDLLAILNLIEIRTDQLNGVVENYNDHELGVTFYKSSEQLKQYISSIRKMSYDVAVRAALKPALARNLQSELRTHLYDLLISLRNLLKFSEQIQKKAKLEWNA